MNTLGTGIKRGIASPTVSVVGHCRGDKGKEIMEKIKVVVLGAPWSGKNTLTDKLADRNAFTVVESGHLIREACKTDSKLNSIVANGRQLPPETSYGLMKDALANLPDRDVAINGFPRQKVNAERLDADATIDKAIHLTAKPEVLFDRYSRNTRAGRNDNGLDILKERLRAYFSRDTDEVLDHYASTNKLVEVNAEEEPEAIYQRITEIIKMLRGGNYGEA